MLPGRHLYNMSATSQDYLLKDTFHVMVGRKRRTYLVTLLSATHVVCLRPLDISVGRIVYLHRQNIIYCRKGCCEDNSGSHGTKDKDDAIVSECEKCLFKILHVNKESLASKVYEFYECAQTTRRAGGKPTADLWCDRICELYRLPTRPRLHKMLVIVNPVAGRGKALTIYRKIQPILQNMDIPYESLITKRPEHALEYLRGDKNISQWGSVLVLSGDGGVHEVLNGIKEKQDWKLILQTITLGVIPVGSGNGLSRSLIHWQKETFEQNGLFSSVVDATRYKSTPMDLMRVQNKKFDKLAFLSVGWGIISDVDIESEQLRLLGELRFTIWAIKRISKLRKYRGKISYLPKEPAAKSEHKETVPENLDEELSASWTVDEGEYLCIYIVNLPFINSTAILAPDCVPDDGVLWLMIVRSETTKSDLLRFLTEMEHGRHLALKGVEMVPVRAFRLEPEPSDKGNITVDGERVVYGAIQGHVLPGACRVMRGK